MVHGPAIGRSTTGALVASTVPDVTIGWPSVQLPEGYHCHTARVPQKLETRAEETSTKILEKYGKKRNLEIIGQACHTGVYHYHTMGEPP